VKITLRPKIDWVGAPPSAQQLDELHHKSHDHCYIANTVNAHVDVQSR
jgi:organic hydroperoxide reductase OsmC/OhrA